MTLREIPLVWMPIPGMLEVGLEAGSVPIAIIGQPGDQFALVYESGESISWGTPTGGGTDQWAVHAVALGHEIPRGASACRRLRVDPSPLVSWYAVR